jgi:hypothetical protein
VQRWGPGPTRTTPPSRCSLDVLFTTRAETGYPFLTEMYFWNLTLRDADVKVLPCVVR